MTTAPANLVPVDYTSRDYLSIREDLIKLVQSRIPEWQANDPADFGVAFVEALAYVGDQLNYYVDRGMAETFLGTASLRQSLLNIASLLGYSPSGRVAATVPLTFTNASTQEQSVPAGAQLATTIRTGDANTPLIFEVGYNPSTPDGSWAVPPNNQSVIIRAAEGRTMANVVLGQSTGAPGQSFLVRDTPLINRSLSISVGPTPDNAVPYTYVQNLYEATGTDNAFTYRTNDEGVTTVMFGDGVSGSIPALYQNIYATYRLGGGVVGNIAHGMPFTPVGFSFVGSITNQVQATGGAEEEDNEHIRQAAYTAFRTRNSAVTKQDFEDLALADNRIAKAKARGNSYASMTVYVAPVSSGELKTDPQPGFDAYNVVSASVTSNKATLVLSESPQFESKAVTISGMGTPWDGTYTATAGPGNTVTFPLTTANRAAQPLTGVLSTGELESFAATRADVARSVQSKGVVGTIVSVLPPRYKDIKVGVKIGIEPQFRQTTAIANVKTAMSWLFSYSQQPFNLTLRPQDVLAFLVNNVPELKYASVDLYDSVTATSTSSSVTGASDEIMRLLPNNLTVTVDPADPGIVAA